MPENKEWEFSEASEEFTLIDDLDILDTTDFEITDLELDSSNSDNSSNNGDEFVSIIENEPKSNDGEIIEPSTIIEEGLVEKTETEEEVKVEELPEEKESQDVAEPVAGESLKEAFKEAEVVTNEAVSKPEEEGETAEEPSEIQREEVIIQPIEEKEEKEMVTKFRQEDLENALKSFLEISPDFQAAAIVSADGFVVASSLPEDTEEAKVGAMAAAILSLGERAAKELKKGNLETVFVEGNDGYVLLSSITDEMLLLVSTSKYAKLGLVFYELSGLKKTLSSFFA